MKPIKFKEANSNLTAPIGMTEDECGDLPVYTDGVECVSYWKLSFKERVRILFFGGIWVGILTGKTQPPMWLDSQKTVFEKPSEDV